MEADLPTTVEKGADSAALATASGRWQAVVAGLLTALAAGLRLAWLTRQSLWYDEANGIRIARESIATIFTEMTADASPPLYYLLLHCWLRLAGDGDVAVRLFSVLFGVALIPVVYELGRRLFSPRAGLCAALLAAVSPFHIHYSQEARMYSMLALFGVLAMASLHKAVQDGALRDWAAYALFTVLALYTHNYGVFVPIAAGVYVLTQLRRARARVILSRFIPAGGLVGLCFAPWLPVMLAQARGPAATGWIPAARWVHGLDTFIYFAGLQMFSADGILYWVGVPLFGACFLAGFLAVRRVGGRLMLTLRGDSGTVLLLCHLLVTLGVPMLVSVWKPIYLPYRYSIIAWPAFILLAGRGLAAWRRPAIWAPVASGLLAITAGALFWYYAVQQKAPDRDVAQVLEALVIDGDLVVFSPHWAGVGILHYMSRTPPHLGYPLPALAEREPPGEATPASPRNPAEMLALVEARLDVAAGGGRLFLVRGPWEPESPALKDALAERFVLLKTVPAGYLELGIYVVP